MRSFVLGSSAAALAAGASLNLSFTDCGGGSTPGTVSDLKPSSIALGSKTTVTGSGTLKGDTVAAGTFEIDLKASIISQTFTGDLCEPKSFSLPLGTGSLAWVGVACPLSPGAVQIPVDVTLSASLPTALQKVELKISGADSSAKKLLCMDITTAPAVSVHPERAAQIAEIQNTPSVLWKAIAHPRFADKAPGASKDMNGVKGDHKKAIEDAIARGEMVRQEVDENAVAAESFDSEENWPQCAKIIGDIRDQSNCGCCWAFGGAEAASDRLCIATNASIMVPLSAQDVCFNSNFDGCDGGQIDTPWSFIKSTGAVTGGQYQGSGPFGSGLCSSFSLPHCHHHGPTHGDPYPAEGQPGCPSESSPRGPKKCDSDAKAPHNDFATDQYSYTGQTISASGEAGIQQAIMKGGPVETAFTVYSDFENYGGGIYHHVSGGMAGGHAVKMVGWGVENGQKYWKVANSWNPYWGEKGYFRIRRGNNEGGIEDGVAASSPTAKWSKKGEAVVV